MENDKYKVIFSCVGGMLLAIVVLLAIADKRPQSRKNVQVTSNTEKAAIKQCSTHIEEGDVATKRADTVRPPAADSNAARKYDDSVFESSYTCEEETTQGMVQWAKKMKRIEAKKVRRMQDRLLAHACDSAKEHIRKEIESWNNLAECLADFMTNNTILANYDGGTIGVVLLADVPLKVCYIRSAQLSADSDIKEKAGRPHCSDRALADSIRIVAKRILLKREYKYNTELAEAGWRYGDKTEYIQYHKKMKRSVSSMNKAVPRWMADRRELAETYPLPDKKRINANTNKQLRTILNMLKGEDYY